MYGWRKKEIDTFAHAAGDHCLDIVGVFLGKVVITLDARIRRHAYGMILVLSDPVVAKPELDHAAYAALAQRRTIRGGIKLVGNSITHTKGSDPKTIEAEQRAGTRTQRVELLSKSMRKCQIPRSFGNMLWRRDIDYPIVVRFVAFFEIKSCFVIVIGFF